MEQIGNATAYGYWKWRGARSAPLNSLLGAGRGKGSERRVIVGGLDLAALGRGRAVCRASASRACVSWLGAIGPGDAERGGRPINPCGSSTQLSTCPTFHARR